MYVAGSCQIILYRIYASYTYRHMKGSVNETGEIYWRRGNTMDADKHRAVEVRLLACSYNASYANGICTRSVFWVVGSSFSYLCKECKGVQRFYSSSCKV